MQSHAIFAESNDTASESIQVFNNAAGLEYSIKAALAPIPTPFYPNNPGQSPVLPLQGDTAYSYAGKFLSVLFTLTNITNTWQSGKDLYYAENKNLDLVADFTYNFLKTGMWFALIGLLAAGLVLIAPYLLIAMAGLGVLYGAFNVGKHLVGAYKAHKEQDLDTRNEHLKAIPGQLLITAINTIGVIFGVHMGVDLMGNVAQAMNLSQAGQLLPALKIMLGVGSSFQALKTMFVTLAAGATLGAISSKATWDMNLDTGKTLIQCIKHPVQQLRQAKNVVIDKCIALKTFVGRNPLKAILAIPIIALEILSLATKLVTRLIALAATPLLLIGSGLRKASHFCWRGVGSIYNKIRGEAKSAELEKSPLTSSQVAPKLPSSNSCIEMALIKKHTYVKQEIQQQLAHLATQPKTEKVKAKIELVLALEKKTAGSIQEFDVKTKVEDLKAQAMATSSRVYQSFWRHESKTARVARLVQNFETERKLAG